MISRSRLPTVIVGGLVSLGLLAGLADAVRSSRNDYVGDLQPAIPFNAIAPDGTLVSLDAYRDRVVLIDFFASWCKPCEHTMPKLLSVANGLADRGVVVLAASCDEDTSDRDAKVRAFFNRINVIPPQIVYPTAETQRRYAVEGYPTTVLIDRAHRARLLSPDAPPLQIRGALERALATGPSWDASGSQF